MLSAVSTVEDMRRGNLARFLELVHRERALSRAQLTTATGLNRSTVAALAAELVDLGFVTERAPDPTKRVGRPSPVVAANPDVVVLAANPEVDALTLAAVGLDGTIRLRERHETAALPTPEETVTQLTDARARWKADTLAGARFVGVGVAVPGLVRAADGVVRHAPHLGWRDAPLRAMTERATGLPAAVDNDATLGAIAEHRFGAGMGVDNLVYLNGGASGIGGGVIVAGMPLGGASGYAGEFGQNRPGIASATHRRADDGVLEDEVSRARLLAAARLSAADEPTLAAALTASPEIDVRDEITRQRGILATALANAVNVLNPSVVILGGFLATLADSDPAALVEAMRAQCMPAAADDVEIRTAALAEDRLLIGASEAAFAPLLADPAGALASA
ncbi:ROK family transcriptional regulator [Microbacterium xanthum]|uniref:ROK family transcriptional regulator n=1 Tax=Microbacterium xanthum TaxID=3079794 RepID=UPI002AD273E9|nr:ROK family transcriptional regulator [Microbacterium sp. KSW-48]MDZ8171589.1 ROK family transcriptional regulator [Microbacterium sp. KSW-48]